MGRKPVLLIFVLNDIEEMMPIQLYDLLTTSRIYPSKYNIPDWQIGYIKRSHILEGSLDAFVIWPFHMIILQYVKTSWKRMDVEGPLDLTQDKALSRIIWTNKYRDPLRRQADETSFSEVEIDRM